MTRDELATFIQLTAERRLRVVCSSSLQLAQHRFTTSLPADFMPALHVLLGDLRALSGWQNKICLLKEHLLPPSAYLREHYATANRVWLPLLYVQRAIRGGWKLRLRTGSPPSSSGCHRCRRKA